MAKKKNIGACFLDLSAPYDRVNLHHLELDLRRLEIPQPYISLIKQLLHERLLQVLFPGENTLLGPRQTQKGLPQGSPLSPILFNIYLNIPPGLMVDNTQIIQYADDFCMLSEHNNLVSCVKLLNISLYNLACWLEEKEMIISPTKSSAIHFTARGSRRKSSSVTIRDQEIAWTSSYRYLGFLFDNNLTWDEHIQAMQKKLHKGHALFKH